MSIAEHSAKVRNLISMVDLLRWWWYANFEEMGALQTPRRSTKAQQKLVIGKLIAFKEGLDEIVDSGVDLSIYQIQHHGDKPVNHHREAIFWLGNIYAMVRGRLHRAPAIPGAEREIARLLGLPALEPYTGPDELAAIERYVRETWPAVTARMEFIERMSLDMDFLDRLEGEGIKAVASEERKQRDERLAAASAEGAHAVVAIGGAAKGQGQAAGSETGAALHRPAKYLVNWREILVALGMKNNSEDREKVRNLNEMYDGPILFPKQGAQPKVEKTKLVEWWNGLEVQWATGLNRARDSRPTVAGQHNYGRTGTAVPGISGGVKKRRKDRKG
jgi:hypothetical protein